MKLVEKLPLYFLAHATVTHMRENNYLSEKLIKTKRKI